MLQINDLSLSFGADTLFKEGNITFNKGNCYGIIGANGAGKTTLLKIISGEIEPSTGSVFKSEEDRMSVLKQDHNAFNEFTVSDTIIMGNKRLYEIQKQKDALYEKEDFTEQDGILASELEAEFAEMGGWDAQADAGKLLTGLGLSDSLLDKVMGQLQEREKVKVLLAQALFGQPDIILLDEPTNGIDITSVRWLEDFLMDFSGTVIVVSHDRHFLNTVCTHIIDIDYGKIKLYMGNYEFWYDSSQLMQRLIKNQNKKKEEKIKELQTFIARFSANKSKARQATSRKKLLEKITVEELPSSSRRYPYVDFEMDREAGKEILTVENLSKKVNGEYLIKNLSFRMNKGDKIAVIGEKDIAATMLFKILMGEETADEGDFKWGISTSQSYFPSDNTKYFAGCDMSILDWLMQYSRDTTETYLRSFLGRMLFTQEEVFKPVKVLSGGEKVRCMLSRMMMFGANVLVMDQPTNHLDLEAIEALNNGLIDFEGNIIFSCHDHEFVQTVANRIIELTADGFVDKICSYDDYLELDQ
ncbi:MAG: ATP-binding cassette domain-containing protein [Eubacteriaceae bacterium]|nr:ATP-binding cassette domain-containing protein [Eubacteriaceae bacterium]